MEDVPMEPDHELEYITCPLCGMNRKLYKTGGYARKREARHLLQSPLGSKAPGQVRFDTMNLETALLLQVREAGSLAVLGWQTLAEIVASREHDDIIDQLRQQIKKISQIID